MGVRTSGKGGALFNLEQDGEAGIFKLTGELDISNATEVVERLGPIAKQQGDLRLDLSGLSFIDSSGIHAIVKLSKEMTGSRRLLLASPSPAVARALRLVRVDTFPNVEIVEEAAST